MYYLKQIDKSHQKFNDESNSLKNNALTVHVQASTAVKPLEDTSNEWCTI